MTLKVTDTSGLTGSASATATIVAALIAPTANAGGPYTGTAGTSLSFSGGGSSDAQGQSLTYAWNFGDSTTGTGVAPTHTYAAAGTYSVMLKVTDASGLTGSASAAVTIAPAPPVANAGGPYLGIEGTALTFNASGSTDPQGEVLTYAWNFGDGNTGTGVSPSHTYTALGTYTVKLTVTNTSNLSATATAQIIVPNGRVYGGLQPIAGSHVYLFAANTTGYGQASVPLLTASATGTSDSVGAYVLTGSDGSFFWNGDYTCTPGAQVYLYALGGNAGSGTNSASGLLAVLGTCPSTGNFSAVPYITVNEVSTVTAAYALSGFATDATHVSSSGTVLAQTGVANAFANAANLASLSTGVALATTPAGNGTVPQTEINTLANILASCVNTGSCTTLLTTATSDATSNGIEPTATATAAINIAHHPGANVSTLYALGTTAVFTPMLATQPNNFTVALNFTGGGIADPLSIAIDGSGNAWIANGGASGSSVTKISSTGSILSGTSGYTGGGLNHSSNGIAIDPSGNAWIINPINNGGSVTMLSNSGTVLSGANGYTGGGLNGVEGMAIDGSGNAWITDFNGSGAVTEISSSGTFLSGSSGYSGGSIGGPTGIAIDGSGKAWIANGGFDTVTQLSNSGAILSGTNGYKFSSNSISCLFNEIAMDASGDAWIACADGNAVSKISGTGTILSGANGYTGGGLNEPKGIAIDGSGNAWITNEFGNSVTNISSTGSVLSGTNGYTSSGLNDPMGIAIDGAGDVWITSVQYVVEFVGAATPVVTPLAVGVKNNMLGTRP
jgi:PKD repeat protein